MALKSERKTIGGVEYVIGQVTATRSVKLLARLGRVLGPALGELASLFEDADPTKPLGEQDVNFAKAGGFVRSLFAGLTDAEIDGLLAELLSNVAALTGECAGPLEGDPKKIDAHFSGRVEHLFSVLYASLEVNFGGFFGVVAALAPGLAAALKGRMRSAASST